MKNLLQTCALPKRKSAIQQRCAEVGFLDSYYALASKVLTFSSPGVTSNLKNLIESYFSYTLVLCFEKLDEASQYFVGHSASGPV